MSLIRSWRWLRPLYVQVLIGMALGIALGASVPDIGAAMKPPRPD